MKCQHCGNQEASFHYEANINGSVTEAHLCGECARELGIMPEAAFELAPPFAGMLRGLLAAPARTPRYAFGFPIFPGLAIAPAYRRMERPAQEGETRREPAAEIDQEMKSRRELNVLREQMRQAAEREDFERAAQIRDSIRKLEGGE